MTQAKKPVIALLVHTTGQSYTVYYQDLSMIRSCTSQDEVASWGTAERPGLAVDLGEFLEATPPVWPQRATALVVVMRRRPIAFLVKHIEQMLEQPDIQPLPEIMHSSMRQQWATGVFNNAGFLSIVLDLRELARTILVSQRPEERKVHDG